MLYIIIVVINLCVSSTSFASEDAPSCMQNFATYLTSCCHTQIREFSSHAIANVPYIALVQRSTQSDEIDVKSENHIPRATLISSPIRRQAAQAIPCLEIQKIKRQRPTNHYYEENNFVFFR